MQWADRTRDLNKHKEAQKAKTLRNMISSFFLDLPFLHLQRYIYL